MTNKDNVEYAYLNRMYKGSEYKSTAKALEFLHVLIGYEAMENSLVCDNTVTLDGAEVATFCWDDALQMPIFTFNPDYPNAEEISCNQEILIKLLKKKP